MKIVKILGGLGNQMFQYALAISLQERFKDEVIKIDTSCFNGYPLHDGFLLDRIFKLNIRKATKKEVIKLNYPLFHYRLWQIGKRLLPPLKTLIKESKDLVYEPQIFSVSTSKYYDGYWQSEKYFDNCIANIRDAFKFPKLDSINQNLIEKLNGKISVSIHIRRGDYLKDPLFRGLTDIDYYNRAIQYILNVVNVDCFVIFSNDIEWCKQNIAQLTNLECVFVNWNKGVNSFRDMQLMSLCKHNIIANSSFSWWGAWLNNNPEKIVITPLKWINREYKTDIIPSSWIKI